MNDLISRKALLAEYDRAHIGEPGKARKLIEDAPAAVRWIPVEERLPEDVYGKDREKILVLVRTKSGNVSQCARCADYDCKTDATLSRVAWIKNGQFYWSKGKKVTHWMPLPEAPKGE